MKLTFLDSFALNPGDLSWDELTQFGELKLYDRTSPEDVVSRAAGSEVVFTNKVRLGEAEFAALPDLRLVCVAATGFDVIDLAAARRHGVAVTNVPAYSTLSVVQHTLALLFESTNHVGHYAQANARGAWASNPDFSFQDAEHPLVEVASLHIGVVGYGNIGERVTNVLTALGAKVSVVTSRPEADLPEGVSRISLAQAFADCDVVTLHCPLRAENKGFVNAGLLESCREGLTLINTARGGLIDEQAVADALRTGKLRAYCADVLTTEPPSHDNPLLSAPNTYITQHIAWASASARRRVITIMHNNVKAFLGGEVLNRVEIVRS